MDSKIDNKNRCLKKGSRSKEGGDYTPIQAQKGGTFRVSFTEEESCSRRNIQKNEKRMIYDPLIEHLDVMTEYIKILNMIAKKDKAQEICGLINMVDLFKKQCEIFFNIELRKTAYDRDN